MSREDVCVCVSLQLGISQYHCFLDPEKCGCKNCDLEIGEGQEMQLWGMPAHATWEERAGVREVN